MNYLEKVVCAWDGTSERIIAMPSQLARTHFLYVQEVGHFRSLPAYRTERASLRSYLLCCTMAGRGFLTYEGKTWTLEAGQAFLIDCMQHHVYHTDPEQLWELVWIHVHGPLCAGYYECFRNQSPPVFRMSNDSPLPGLIHAIMKAQQNRDFRTELQCSQLIMELLTEIVQATLASSLPSQTVPEWVSELARYLDHNFRDKLTLELLSSRAMLNKYQLTKEFKRYTGLTPNEYLIRNRLTYAKELLTYSDHTVAEVAGMSGIDNVTHFINLFKAREELTPLAYRKKWRLNSSKG